MAKQPTTSHPIRKAFTLIELLVVISIIVIMVALAIPALKVLGQSNNQRQAVNLLTSLIANARASAIQSHTQAGLVIYDDPSFRAGSSAQLVIMSSQVMTASGPVTYFIRYPRTVAQRFPSGVMIATLDNAASGGTIFKAGTNFGSTAVGRIILFDENGQLIMHNTLTRDSSLNGDTSAMAWVMESAAPAVSSPGFIVYDTTEAQAAVDTGKVTSTTFGPWIEQHADVIVINPYTGNVIR